MATTVYGGGSGDSITGIAAGSAAAPSLSWGDGDSGFYEISDDNIRLSIGGADEWRISATEFRGVGTRGPRWSLATGSLAAVPHSFVGDADTGLHSPAADNCELVAGAQSCIGCAETGAAPQVGFYGTTPISLQTGVAVTDAGIHAALVALGLITA